MKNHETKIREGSLPFSLSRKITNRLHAGLLAGVMLSGLLQVLPGGLMNPLSAQAAESSKPVALQPVPTVPKNGLQYTAPGPVFPVAAFNGNLNDASRKRPIPFKVFYPASGAGPFPLIIFSHGLGGSHEQYGYVGRYLANKGYVVIHPDHVGSDGNAMFGSAVKGDEAVKAASEKAEKGIEPFYNDTEAINRTKDVSYVIDSLPAIEAMIPALKGKVNRNIIGLAGHSYGSLTTGLVAGMTLTPPGKPPLDLSDKRIRAFMLMSPDGSKAFTNQLIHYNTADYAKIKSPILFLSGEFDTVLLQVNPLSRLEPFQLSPATGNKYHGFLNDSTHLDFAELTLNPKGAGYQNAVNNTMNDGNAFFDAYLKNRPEAVNYLKTKLKPYVQSSQSILLKK